LEITEEILRSLAGDPLDFNITVTEPDEQGRYGVHIDKKGCQEPVFVSPVTFQSEYYAKLAMNHLMSFARLFAAVGA
jgi:hypothetical protein